MAFLFHIVKFGSLRGATIKSIYFFLHFVCFGIFVFSLNVLHYQKKNSNPSQNTYILKSAWNIKGAHYRARASIDQNSILKNGDLLIYCKSVDRPVGLPGDFLITHSKYQVINPPLNPDEFDYKSYMEMQGIAYTLFLKKDQYIIKENKDFTFLRFFSKFREVLLKRIDAYPLNEASKALIKALLFGDKSSLDPEITNAFSIAGASHVLAVSGLHVGIIVILFSHLLSLIKIMRAKLLFKWSKIVLLISIIWLFAGISGFSPSILRASIMFTFISIGQSLNRNTSIYNSLSIAAFFMLIINPNNLFNVGFQLSFLAVLSIVFFYDRIYTSFYFRHRFIQKIWSISCVSIAAQIGTFPLALYYFHQFPVYFILSNLIVIPAAFIILLISILILFSPFNFLIDLLSMLLNMIIHFLNNSIILVGKIPFSAIDEIYISTFSLFSILLSLLSFALFIQTKKRIYFHFTLLFTCALFSYQIIEKHINLKENRMIIYSIPNQNAIDLIQGSQHVLFIDSALFNTPEKLLYAGSSYWNNHGLNSFENNQKVVFEKMDTIKQSNYLIGKSHLIFENNVICINHLSHEDQLINAFQYKIALVNKLSKTDQKHLPSYDKIIVNTQLNKELFNFLSDDYPKSIRPKIHFLSIDRYYELTY